MLYKAITVSAILAMSAGNKVDSMADFYKEQVKQAFISRDGVVDFDNFENLNYERVFNALMKQGVITDKDKPINLKSLSLNMTWSGDRRRLSTESDCLSKHNEGRTDTAQGKAEDKNRGYWPQASNLNRLVWDDELARVAQNYADKCDWGHNGNRNREFNEDAASFSTGYGGASLGENIAWGYGSSQRAIWSGWYEEHTDGFYTTGSSCKDCGVIGHYTQMVWADTRYVGCGYADCGGDYLVCNYYPPGNYGDQYCYERGSPCSNCDADRNARDCSDSQCGGCPNPDYASCSDYYSNCADLEKWCPNQCSTSSTDNLCTGCRNTCKTGNCPIDSVYNGRC